MWWNRPYVNKRDWILENLKTLKLAPEQVLLLLMIDYMNTQNERIELEVLAQRLNLDVRAVDALIHDLTRQQKLAIQPMKDRIHFSLDPLFDEGEKYEYMDENIFEVFEGEFGRLLSQPEMQMLNQWLAVYTQEEILEGLRNAIVYQKLSMKYIQAILQNKRNES